jgi:hypothetical protein
MTGAFEPWYWSVHAACARWPPTSVTMARNGRRTVEDLIGSTPFVGQRMEAHLRECTPLMEAAARSGSESGEGNWAGNHRVQYQRTPC